MKTLITLIFMTFSLLLNAQVYKYKIICKGKDIGEIEVKKTVKDTAIYYDITGRSTVTMFFTESIKYHLSSIYINGAMFYSSATIYLNDKVHFNSVVQQENGYYTLNKKGHQSRFLGSIIYSGAMLYFTEPSGIDLIFSEIDNIEKNITKLADHKYKIVNPKTNNASVFNYVDGILESADIDHTYVSFSIKRVY
ncbi:MAG: hypothetical protein DSY76_08700 [Bacteroidetes bacterium]|nr:MAG: hypothetical protein DSY76_08700 [Bacteroidota bacterium]